MSDMLNKLLKPFDFPTFPEDDIENVKITMMQLEPFITISVSNLIIFANFSRYGFNFVSKPPKTPPHIFLIS